MSVNPRAQCWLVAPSPAQPSFGSRSPPWGCHSPQLLEGPSTPWGWQGMALQASHCGTPAPLSTMLLTGRVECGASLTCPPSPTALSWAQPRLGPHEGRTGAPGPCSPLLLVCQHGLRDGQLVREAGSSDELGDTASNVHSVCGCKEP